MVAGGWGVGGGGGGGGGGGRGSIRRMCCITVLHQAQSACRKSQKGCLEKRFPCDYSLQFDHLKGIKGSDTAENPNRSLKQCGN